MSNQREIRNLEEVLQAIDSFAKGRDTVTLGSILETVGRRSFGPILLIAGLITVAPIVGDVPGVPTVMALFVFLISTQLLFRGGHFWLPQWLLRRSIKSRNLQKALGYMNKPARFVDRFLRPRFTMFVSGWGERVIAVTTLLIATIMPLMEVIPFSANVAGAALTAFGLSLIAKDGLVAGLAFMCTAGVVGFILPFVI